MAVDPRLAEEVCQWFTKAKRDLRAAQVTCSVKPPLRDVAVYHAQQAVEKATKGYLTWCGRPFRKTHNLLDLAQSCVDVDGRLEAVLRPAAKLTVYATRFRYPGGVMEPSAREASEAIRTARRTLSRLLASLPRKVRARTAAGVRKPSG